MQYVRSPIVFHQMLGRGTRIDRDPPKLMFRVFDYTDATSLIGDDFKTKFKAAKKKKKPGPPAEPPAVVEGVQIRIDNTGRWLTAAVDGRHARISLEEYRERIAERLIAEAANLADFRHIWIHPSERRGLINAVVRGGFSPRALQVAEEADACDLYDVLGEVAYGLPRRTRADRAFAFTYKHGLWLAEMPPPAAATVRAISSQFARAGTEALETAAIFSTPEVVKAGGLTALKMLGEPGAILLETKERLFAA
jgi:type I restriction enzyme R subunit